MISRLPSVSFRSASELRIRRGFTLIELLVSMTILAMLVVLFAQALGNISSAWARGQEKMDNFGKARAILNRMQIDLQNIVVRDDLPVFPFDGSKSQLSFYTLQPGINNAAGAADRRSLSYVNYASSLKTKETDQLLRTDTSYTYGAGDSPAFSAAPTPTPSPPPQPDPTPPTFSKTPTDLALFEGQLGFSYGFLHPDGTYSSRYDQTADGKDSKAVAVTVGLLVMDNKNSAVLRDRAGGRDLLAELIGECVIDNGAPIGVDESKGWSPKAVWDYQLGLSSDAPKGGASPISIKKYGSVFLAGVRAFERTFPISSPDN